MLHIEENDKFPMFAQIREILISSNEKNILFYCNVFRTLAFWEHIFAYEVEKTSKTIFVEQLKLSNHRPVLPYEHSKKIYIVTKSAV